MRKPYLQRFISLPIAEWVNSNQSSAALLNRLRLGRIFVVNQKKINCNFKNANNVKLSLVLKLPSAIWEKWYFGADDDNVEENAHMETTMFTLRQRWPQIVFPGLRILACCSCLNYYVYVFHVFITTSALAKAEAFEIISLFRGLFNVRCLACGFELFLRGNDEHL